MWFRRSDLRPHRLLRESRLPRYGRDGRHGRNGRVRRDILRQIERKRGLVEEQVVVLTGPTSLRHVERRDLVELFQSERLLRRARLGLPNLLQRHVDARKRSRSHVVGSRQIVVEEVEELR